MMRSLLAGMLGAFAMTTCAAIALADDAYRFTVPYSVTLPSSYAGSMILNVRCGVGGSALAFDSASGVAREVIDVASSQVALGSGSPANLGDVKGQNKDSQASAASQVQLLSQVSQMNSTKGSEVSQSQANLGAAAAQDSQLSQISQMKGTPRQFNGTATVLLPAKAALIGGIVGPAPTTYLCWGQIGNGATYTAAPFVKGTLPTVIR